MTYAIQIHPQEHLAGFLFHGPVSVAQGTRAFLDYIRMPGFDPTHNMLTDARDVTAVEADFHRIFFHVANLLPQLGHFPKGSLSVVLLAGEPVLGHIQTLSKVLEWSSNIRMVSTRDESQALQLLGVRAGLSCDDLVPRRDAATGAAAR